jgi:DNA-binding FadR family transcriptional regulator
MIELAKAQDIADYLRAMEVRDALEGQSARLAAERHNAEQMGEITRALDAMRRALDEGTATAEVDYAFHRAVAVASGNIVIVEILEALNDTITGGMQVALGLTREGSRERSQRVVDEHVRVHEAILAREAASAEIAMRYHIDQARRRLTDRRRDT